MVTKKMTQDKAFMNKKGKILMNILFFVLVLVITLSIVFYCLNPLKETIDYCEEEGWDGREYNTGVVDYKIFGESKEIVIKCNKAKETDAIVGIINSLYFWE